MSILTNLILFQIIWSQITWSQIIFVNFNCLAVSFIKLLIKRFWLWLRVNEFAFTVRDGKFSRFVNSNLQSFGRAYYLQQILSLANHRSRKKQFVQSWNIFHPAGSRPYQVHWFSAYRPARLRLTMPNHWIFLRMIRSRRRCIWGIFRVTYSISLHFHLNRSSEEISDPTRCI